MAGCAPRAGEPPSSPGPAAAYPRPVALFLPPDLRSDIVLLGDLDCPLCVDEVLELRDLPVAFEVPVRILLAGPPDQALAKIGPVEPGDVIAFVSAAEMSRLVSGIPGGHRLPVVLVPAGGGQHRVFRGSTSRERVLRAWRAAS